MKLFLDEAGNTHEAVYLDGYDFADRLLEGVLIKIEVDDDDRVKASFQEDDSEYVSTLNETKLLAQAVCYVQDLIADGDLSGLSPSPRQVESYDMMVELLAGPAPSPTRPSP